MSALFLAYFGAGAIALGSAIFGVGIARMFWADDLAHVQAIEAKRKDTDLIKDQIEHSLRETIKALDGTIRILKERLGEGDR